MPNLGLSSAEAESIAAFLLDAAEVARIKYSYYEGSWQNLPDFSTLKPKTSGSAEKIDVSLRERDNQFALRFEAYLRIDEAGAYPFHIGSDDGSRLLIDGRPVAGKPGVHPYQVDRPGGTPRDRSQLSVGGNGPADIAALVPVDAGTHAHQRHEPGGCGRVEARPFGGIR